MSSRRILVVGGGAAGFFAAITCAEAARDCEVVVLEKGPQFLSKVRISGGGRCNVTHACFDPRELARRFPRGEKELISLFHQFQAEDTVAWFEQRGVKLKTESDGRMFPVTDSSETIVQCLVQAAMKAGVKLVENCGVSGVIRDEGGGFEVSQTKGTTISCEKLLLATGGCRTAALGQLAVSLGHTLAPPVPSLFTFHIETPWLRELAGISVPDVEGTVAGAGLKTSGALLVTHWGLSGPMVLRLSAWGARELNKLDYRFTLRLNWLPERSENEVAAELASRRPKQSARKVTSVPMAPLPSRLWEQLVNQAGIAPATRWADLSNSGLHQLVQKLCGTELPVTGKSLNKDEFVTCGGVRLNEVNFKTMESRICPGLFFAGELLDIDGITGGFNFQAAWTTGWIAGQAMARDCL
jgi:predicted Rossmann fold flavoprotein